MQIRIHNTDVGTGTYYLRFVICVFCTQILGKNTPVLVRMRMASFFNPEVTWVDQGNNLPSFFLVSCKHFFKQLFFKQLRNRI
jgi:hypothetical protein